MGERAVGSKSKKKNTGGTPVPPQEIARAVEAWFRANARAMPWRASPVDGPRDPYASLVSELMLQQTQVSRVMEKFGPFMQRFPTVAALAAAPEPEVLAAWSGLGYYRRARLLHAAARAVVERHGGIFPQDAAALRALPGVGRYTAGAIGSIVFGDRVPLLDGNVERVLLRLHANADPPKDKATQDWAWAQAQSLVDHAAHPGMLNEGLMELGATVCNPIAPRCLHCPVRDHCAAFAQGRTEEIPTPKPRAKQKDWFIVCFVVEDAAARVLVETRALTGLWAGMAQPPSAEGDTEFTLESAAAAAGVIPVAVTDRFTHITTHRRVAFTVVSAAPPKGLTPGRRWVSRETLATLALSNAHRRVFGLM